MANEMVNRFIADIEIASAVRFATGIRSVFSVSGVRNFREVPFPGEIRKVAYVGGWDYRHIEAEGGTDLTWLDLYRIGDQLIAESKDYHHTFIERFDRHGDVLVMTTGS